MELRDEARYLDLDELYQLCTSELRARQSLGFGRSTRHNRVMSSVSTSSSSVKSFGMGPLREDLEEEEERGDYFQQKKLKRRSKDSGVGSSSSNSMGSVRGSTIPEVVMSPSSVSFGLAQRDKVRPKKSASVRGRPAGEWI